MRSRKMQSTIIWVLILIGYLIVFSIPFFVKYNGVGRGIEEAMTLLRDKEQFNWYVIPFLLIVIYVYSDEASRKNWSGIVAGIGFFLWDVFNEIWNGLYYKITGYAGPWIANMPTAYQVTIGWNIEIIFNFLLMGIASTKLLPDDKDKTILGINNRHVIAIIMASLCVFVEIILNKIGALVWNYPWWNAKFPFLIFLIGYLPFWEFSFFLYDMEDLNKKIKIISFMGVLLIVAFSIFVYLRWI